MAEKAEGDFNAKLAKLALTDHLVELTKAISASPATFRIIVDGCLQQGLITDHVHGDLTDPTTGRSLYEKAGELIRNIETAVGTRASYIDNFLKILAKDGGIPGQKVAEAIANKFGPAHYQEINPQQKDDFTSNPKQPPSDIDIQIYQPYFNMKFTDDLLVLLALEDLKPQDAVSVFGMEDDPFINRILQLDCNSTKIETMYSMWKEKIANDVTYSIIIEALLRNNHHVIAQSIGESLKEKYLKPEDITHFQPEQSYPNWDGFNNREKEYIKRILRNEMTEITKYFNKTFIAILRSFKEAHRNHCDELIITLNKELKTSISLKQIHEVRDVFKFIEKKGCDWINYHLLDMLTYHHGTEEDKLQMKDYVKKLWTYLQRSLYKIPLPSCEATTAEIHEYHHFILPVTSKKDISGQQVKQIQLMLAEKLNIPVAVIKIKARTGSIIIHFIVNKQHFSDHDDTYKLAEFTKDTRSNNIYYIDVKWLENIPYNSELLPIYMYLTNETTTPLQKERHVSLADNILRERVNAAERAFDQPEMIAELLQNIETQRLEIERLEREKRLNDDLLSQQHEIVIEVKEKALKELTEQLQINQIQNEYLRGQLNRCHHENQELRKEKELVEGQLKNCQARLYTTVLNTQPPPPPADDGDDLRKQLDMEQRKRRALEDQHRHLTDENHRLKGQIDNMRANDGRGRNRGASDAAYEAYKMENQRLQGKLQERDEEMRQLEKDRDVKASRCLQLEADIDKIKIELEASKMARQRSHSEVRYKEENTRLRQMVKDLEEELTTLKLKNTDLNGEVHELRKAISSHQVTSPPHKAKKRVVLSDMVTMIKEEEPEEIEQGSKNYQRSMSVSGAGDDDGDHSHQKQSDYGNRTVKSENVLSMKYNDLLREFDKARNELTRVKASNQRMRGQLKDFHDKCTNSLSSTIGSLSLEQQDEASHQQNVVHQPEENIVQLIMQQIMSYTEGILKEHGLGRHTGSSAHASNVSAYKKSYSQLKESSIPLSSGTQLLNESVSATITFNVSGGTHKVYKWDEYSLSIDIPATALPQDKTTVITVKAMLPNCNFLIPDNVYLVSGIYWIQCHDMFQERVTLCIKHAAIVDSDEEASHFKFFAAKCSEGPPYEFKPLHHGHFPPHLPYSTIQLKQFSFFTIGSVDNVPFQYYNVRVFYRLRNPPDIDWDMIVAMTKNEPVIVQKMMKYYSDCVEDIELNPVVFDAEKITLEVAENNDGWKIIPLKKTSILKESVQSFKESSLPIGPSHSQFQILWEGQPPIAQSWRKVSLNGASNKYDDYFIARLPPKNNVMVGGHSHKVDGTRLNLDNFDTVLRELMSITEWYQLGLALKLSSRTLDEIECKCRGDVTGCRREMVRHWLRMSPNVTDSSWKALVDALKDDLVKEIAIAKKITNKYSI